MYKLESLQRELYSHFSWVFAVQPFANLGLFYTGTMRDMLCVCVCVCQIGAKQGLCALLYIIFSQLLNITKLTHNSGFYSSFISLAF